MIEDWKAATKQQIEYIYTQAPTVETARDLYYMLELEKVFIAMETVHDGITDGYEDEEHSFQSVRRMVEHELSDADTYYKQNTAAARAIARTELDHAKRFIDDASQLVHSAEERDSIKSLIMRYEIMHKKIR